MQKAHQNINWENKPSTETPINETNLNLMDRSIDTIDDRVVAFDTTKANQSDLLQGVSDVTFTKATGTFHVEHFNGVVTDIDTDLEKVVINFYYDKNPQSPHYQSLVLTLDDGSVEYIDLSALITQYEFTNTGRIAFTVGADGSISADIVGGSITDDKMQPNYLADITAQAQSGAQSAINASGFKLDAEAWAVGTRNGQAVPQSDPAYHNNSKYWAAQANVTSLEALTDVYIDQPRDLQYLGYDATEEYFTLMDIPQADSTPVRLIVISEEGSSVTITTPAGDTVTPTHIQSGQWQADFFGASAYGTYQIESTLGGDTATASVNVDNCKIYVIDDSHFHASIVVTYPAGATVSCVKTGEPTQYATSSPYTFVVHSLGEYTITGTRNGITEVQTVTITASEQVVNITLTILPDGSTITPTDDVQLLLNCADIWDKTTYTTIADLIADDTSLLTVLTSDNAIDYLVRSTTFASAITADEDAMAMIGAYDYASNTLIDDSTWVTAIANSAYATSVINTSNPNMTSDTTPSGEVVCNSYQSGYEGYKAFDGDNTTGYTCLYDEAKNDYYLGYKFPHKVKIIKANVRSDTYSASYWFDNAIFGGDAISSLTQLSSKMRNQATESSPSVNSDIFTCLNAYQYFVLKIVDSNTQTAYSRGVYWNHIYEIKLYGRENGGVQSWLRAGGITDKSYTTLAEVLADTTTLSALIASHDAVDYLVTAKAFIDGIVADATAMSYIGLNNYCANMLLADENWCTAIQNSTYFESVDNVKVPTMTSNTTPSGEAFASSEADPAYYAFDNNSATWWSGGVSNAWVAYDFGQAVNVHKIDFWTGYAGGQRTGNYKIEATNDKNGTWTTLIIDVAPQASASYEIVKIISGSNSYRYWRIFVVDHYMSANYGILLPTIQFYGREDV